MAKRKLKKVEIIILIGFINSTLAFLGIWIWYKAPNRDIYIPENYEGWIRISHSVEGAPPLPKINGRQQLVLPDSGHLITSTKLDVGWRRDNFYWASSKEAIPKMFDKNGEPHRIVFSPNQFSRFYKDLLEKVPVGSDTTLLDETKIKKDKSGRINYIPGKKALQYFYVSPKGQPFSYITPPIEDEDALKSTEDREVMLNSN